MGQSFRILFYENGDPIDPRCICRFVCAFPKRYRKVVETITERSSKLDEKAFQFNVATLMSSFKMTRKGAFHGVKIGKSGEIVDPYNVVSSCWSKAGEKILMLKRYLNENVSGDRRRTITRLSATSKQYVIEKTAELFEELCKVSVETGRVSPVGVSKILFATLPEVALPVDNLEWTRVFGTKDYRKVLLTMIDEITAWENKTGKQLEASDPNGMATLPSIYNVMAMASRPL